MKRKHANGTEEELKAMAVDEFVKFGFLQELNRQFLHPLGVALSIVVEDGKITGFGPIWDYRDDPEGLRFGDDMIDAAKARRVEELRRSKRPGRFKLFGLTLIQSIED